MVRPRKSPVAVALAAAAKAHINASFPPQPLDYQPLPYFAFGFFAPEPPRSVNKTSGRHYGTQHVHKLAWEGAAATAARDNAEGLEVFRGHRVRLTFALPVTRPGSCDAGNFVGGVSVKAAQDGITRTGLLVPDDNNVWLDTAVVFWKGGETKDLVRVKVEVAEPVLPPTLW